MSLSAHKSDHVAVLARVSHGACLDFRIIPPHVVPPLLLNVRMEVGLVPDNKRLKPVLFRNLHTWWR
jgi:hypothetical protein